MDFFESLKVYLSEKEIDNLKQAMEGKNLHAALLNTKKMDDKTFMSLFPDVKKHPFVPHAFLYEKEQYDLGKSIYHLLGCFYLQEPSAMMPAYLLNAKENDIVLDICAAPGGKSIQTSLLLNDTGLVIANDLSKSRANLIIENIERLGLGNVVVTNNDLSTIYQRYINTFDKIILDAPCSGSGMFRKDESVLNDWSYNKVLKFAETQKQLIEIAYSMLKRGGTLCYSTCSFSYEEDEEVIEYLLDKTDAQLVDLSDELFYKNKNKPYGVHLFPHIFPGEGHYICLIKKPGLLTESKPDLYNKNPYGLSFNNVYKYGDYLFGINQSFNLKCFNILRNGVKIGELINKQIKYDYHYAHYVSGFEKTYELNDEELKKYLKGETINVSLEKGIYLLKYKGINVDITNSDGRMIKNHFPKAFRYKSI